MNLLSAIADLVDDPQGFIDRAGTRETGWAGVSGYLFGTFSIFIFLRMFSAVLPGVYSFLNVLLVVTAVNFLFAAVIHLFLEMTGSNGKALKLFFLFGLTEFLWVLLIPLGFIARLGLIHPVIDLFICFFVIIIARISLTRRLYSISRNKALLALGLPYAAAAAGFLIVFVYAIVYLVWLVA